MSTPGERLAAEQRYRPSRLDSKRIEFGTIEAAEYEITISEACDRLNTALNREALTAALVEALRGHCEGCAMGLEAKQANGSGHVNPAHEGDDKFLFPEDSHIHEFSDGLWDMCGLRSADAALIARYEAERERSR